MCELYHKRCAADEQWLESVTVAVFGKEFVELVLSWLASPGDEVSASFDWSVRKSSDRMTGDTLPPFKDLSGVNMLYACCTLYSVVLTGCTHPMKCG
jgi:hypothetical protein